MQGSVATPTKFNMHNFMKDKGFKDEHAKFFNQIDDVVEGEVVKVEMDKESIFDRDGKPAPKVANIFTPITMKKVSIYS